MSTLDLSQLSPDARAVYIARMLAWPDPLHLPHVHAPAPAVRKADPNKRPKPTRGGKPFKVHVPSVQHWKYRLVCDDCKKSFTRESTSPDVRAAMCPNCHSAADVRVKSKTAGDVKPALKGLFACSDCDSAFFLHPDDPTRRTRTCPKCGGVLADDLEG